MKETALVLMGGGARAAYSVGFLRGLAEGLSEEPRFPILSGVSAGAINAAYLAFRVRAFGRTIRSMGAEGGGTRAEWVAGTLLTDVWPRR